jgi:hypothetical protein
VLVVAVALELEHAVDQVLQHARPCDGPVLGDVTDEDRRDAGLLCDPEQPRRGFAHLADRARRGAELGRVQRLHRVDHADLGALLLERRADGVKLGLGEEGDVRGASEPFRAKLDLGRRLLPGYEQRTSRRAHRAQRREQQRRLAHTGLAPDEHERGRDQAAAEDTVELGNSRGDALGLFGLDVEELERRPRRGCSCFGRLFLDERPKLTARRALAEPPPGRVAAAGAGELGRSLGHLPMLGTRADGNCVYSGTPAA